MDVVESTSMESENVENANNSAKVNDPVGDKDENRPVPSNDNDVTMQDELDCSQGNSLKHAPLNHIKNENIGPKQESGNTEKECLTQLSQMDEDITAGTSTSNTSSGVVTNQADSKMKPNRFTKRNYRKPTISSSSSSSNRSTPELKTETENTVSSTRVSGSPERHADEIPDDDYEWEDHDDDDADDDDDDNDDDDDDDNSSGFSFNMDDEDSNESKNETKRKTNADEIKDTILKLEKPNYTRNLLVEIRNREQGLSPSGLKAVEGRSSMAFQDRIYGARQTIERIQLLHTLQKHSGCVNSLNFNKAGNLLASGSDDLKVVIWDWASKKVKYSVHTGHHSNVFQSKFIEYGAAASDIRIVTSGRDGQIRYIVIPPGGCSADATSRNLWKHTGSVHKISPTPYLPYELLTAGEDGNVFRCDLRTHTIEKVCSVTKTKVRKVALYSIAHHPNEPHFCVCGRDQYVRVYDKRHTNEPLSLMCTEKVKNSTFSSHITCALYNSSGSEILASYSDDDIYSFSTNQHESGEYLHRYRGHNNNRTIKGVNYFGPNSEYVVSGSDCGNFFIWDAKTEAILNWKKADYMGVVNCLEPHPSFPVLATSGLDHDVKIWAPTNEKYPPVMEGLEKCLRNNARRTSSSNIFDDRTLYFFVRRCLRNGYNQSFGNMPVVESSMSESDEDGNDCDTGDDLQQQSFPPCNPQ